MKRLLFLFFMSTTRPFKAPSSIVLREKNGKGGKNLLQSEREQVFIATAKGRNGRKSPYTQLRATKKIIYHIKVIHLNGCIDLCLLDSMLTGYEFLCSEILILSPNYHKSCFRNFQAKSKLPVYHNHSKKSA